MTTTMSTTRRSHAGNTPALARIKKAMNTPIYRKALEVWNAGGEAACREYMSQYFNDEARARCLASLFDDKGNP